VVGKSKVLDLMCGNGRISINLAKLGYKVVGIDTSPRKAGLETIEIYKNMITLEPFDSLGPINIVAKAI